MLECSNRFNILLIHFLRVSLLLASPIISTHMSTNWQVRPSAFFVQAWICGCACAIIQSRSTLVSVNVLLTKTRINRDGSVSSRVFLPAREGEKVSVNICVGFFCVLIFSSFFFCLLLHSCVLLFLLLLLHFFPLHLSSYPYLFVSPIRLFHYYLS